MTKRVAQIADVWTDRFPACGPRRHSLIEKIVCTATILLSLISVSNIKGLVRKKYPGSHLFMDVYVIAWIAILVSVLFWGSALSSRIAIGLAVYRLVDIVNYRLLFLFVKSESDPWKEEVIRRSVAMALVNFLEAGAAFAILYLRTASIVHNGTCVPLQSPTEALYYSVVTMTTLGYGDLVPANSTGHWLVIAQLSAAVIFVVFLLPALISVFSPALQARKHQQ
jgi:hypothetical protein